MKKKLVVAATAGAVAMAAGQAFALENVFNGAFAIRGIHSNYAASGYLLSPVTGVGTAQDSAYDNNFVEQRTRLYYTAKANDNLKLVTGFEIDATWGKSSYTQGRSNDGAAIGADTTNIETKNAYLDFNCPITGANFKGGIMPFVDAYKGVFINADAAGILLSKGFGPATAGLGWFRLDDRAETGGSSLGRQTRDLVVLDGKYNVNKDVKVGGSYYYLNDSNAADRNNARMNGKIHTLGANAAATFGPATVDGFLLYQFGSAAEGTTTGGYATSQHISAFAANLGAKVAAGPGTAKLAALYTTGGTSNNGQKSNAFNGINNLTSSSSSEHVANGVLGNTMLLLRSPGSTSQDQSLVYDINFNGYGVTALSAGYDINITPKAFASANVAMGWASVNPNADGTQAYTANQARSKYLGTELNATVGYKLYDNLTASFDASMVVLGGFYAEKGRQKADGTYSDPANPYMTRLNLVYSF